MEMHEDPAQSAKKAVGIVRVSDEVPLERRIVTRSICVPSEEGMTPLTVPWIISRLDPAYFVTSFRKRVSRLARDEGRKYTNG